VFEGVIKLKNRGVHLHPRINSVLRQALPAQGYNLVYKGGVTCKSDWELIQVVFGKNDETTDALSHVLSFSDYLDTLTQNFTNVGIPTFLVEVTSDAQLPSSITDSDIQNLLESMISQGKLKDVRGSGIYSLFFPSGVSISLQGMGSCSYFLGYHNNKGNLYYIVIPYPCDMNVICSPSDNTAFYSYVFSHELVECITDPVPGTGWVVDEGLVEEEIADVCEGNCFYSSLDVQKRYPLNPFYTESGCLPKIETQRNHQNTI
jgi:hypothetical protein